MLHRVSIPSSKGKLVAAATIDDLQAAMDIEKKCTRNNYYTTIIQMIYTYFQEAGC